jgi:hypothetical protein
MSNGLSMIREVAMPSSRRYRDLCTMTYRSLNADSRSSNALVLHNDWPSNTDSRSPNATVPATSRLPYLATCACASDTVLVREVMMHSSYSLGGDPHGLKRRFAKSQCSRTDELVDLWKPEPVLERWLAKNLDVRPVYKRHSFPWIDISRKGHVLLP